MSFIDDVVQSLFIDTPRRPQTSRKLPIASGKSGSMHKKIQTPPGIQRQSSLSRSNTGITSVPRYINRRTNYESSPTPSASHSPNTHRSQNINTYRPTLMRTPSLPGTSGTRINGYQKNKRSPNNQLSSGSRPMSHGTPSLRMTTSNKQNRQPSGNPVIITEQLSASNNLIGQTSAKNATTKAKNQSENNNNRSTYSQSSTGLTLGEKNKLNKQQRLYVINEVMKTPEFRQLNKNIQNLINNRKQELINHLKKTGH